MSNQREREAHNVAFYEEAQPLEAREDRRYDEDWESKENDGGTGVPEQDMATFFRDALNDVATNFNTRQMPNKAKFVLEKFDEQESFKLWYRRHNRRIETIGQATEEQRLLWLDNALPARMRKELWYEIGNGTGLNELIGAWNKLYPGESTTELLKEYREIRQEPTETARDFYLRWRVLRSKMQTRGLTTSKPQEVEEYMRRLRMSLEVRKAQPST